MSHFVSRGFGLVDAANDSKAAGRKVDGGQQRYYAVRFEGPPYVLNMALQTADHGTLDVGASVVDLEYLYLVNGPTTTPRWYHSSSPPTSVSIPAHLVLHAGFEMVRAVLPERGASSQQRQGVSMGAVVLSEADHEAALLELETRAEQVQGCA